MRAITRRLCELSTSDAILIALGLMALVLMAGCTSLTPDQLTAMRAVVDQALADGRISQDQYLAAIRALESQGDWWVPLAETGIDVGLGILGALTGVYLWRGSPNKRRGLPPVVPPPAG